MREIVPSFAGKVVEKDGKIQLDIYEKPRFKRYLRTLLGVPAVEVFVRELKRRRSDRQNRYYWGVVVALLAEYFGYSREEMHEALKMKFLRKEPPDKPATVRSTTDLSTQEFEDYLEEVRQWAAEFYGIDIPLPDEVAEISYE